MSVIVTVIILLLFFILLIPFLLLIILSKVMGGFRNMFYIFTGKGRRHTKAYRSAYSNSGYKDSNSSYNDTGNSSDSDNSQNYAPHHHKKGEKVFNDNEGEYIDFEEIKS